MYIAVYTPYIYIHIYTSWCRGVLLRQRYRCCRPNRKMEAYKELVCSGPDTASNLFTVAQKEK